MCTRVSGEEKRGFKVKFSGEEGKGKEMKGERKGEARGTKKERCAKGVRQKGGREREAK